MAGFGSWARFFLLANWPFTQIAIKPLNNKLMVINLGDVDENNRSQIKVWARLHAVRSALGATSSLAFVLALVA